MAPKAKPAMKLSLTKGKQSPKHKALTKGSAMKGKTNKASSSKAMKVKKGHLKKGMLAKLGKMTLAQKIHKAAEGAESVQEAAQNLKGMLSKEEHSKAWSKHNVTMKSKTNKEKKDFAKLSKGEKGLEVSMHLLRTSVPRFMQVKETMDQSHSLGKREAWESEAAMIQRFGKDEFLQHVQSGRVAWREDPWTWGVYNYCDRGDVTKNTRVRKQKQWTRAQEYEPGEEENEEFDALWNLDGSGHLRQVEAWGKGKSKALTKGNGKGGGKGKKQKGKGGGPLAIKDKEDEEEEEEEEEEKTEEEEWKGLLAKAKRARDQCSSAKADCEAALEGAEKAKRMAKAGKKDTEELLQNLDKKMDLVKQVLAKKDKSMKLDKAKKLLVETGTLMKEVKNEAKELTQLANKAGSKASKR